MKKGYQILAIQPAFADAYAEAIEKLNAYDGSGRTEEEEDLPYLLNVTEAGVGVINIRGKLSNTTSPWARFFGVTPYNDIREALVHAAVNESVQSILLDIDSVGGTVAGMTETADLISTVSNIKPVKAYSAGTMASAAYALGSRADTISISDTAMAGSVGTILSLMTYEKMLEKEGYTPHVIRSGKFKAVGGPMEKLTDESKAYLQEQVDYTANLFLGSVVKERSLDIEGISEVQSGKEFIGKKAVSVGLVDTIESFDDVMNNLVSSHEGDDMKRKYTKQALTEQQIAALASGADVVAGEDVPEISGEAESSEQETSAQAETVETTDEETAKATADARKAELEAKDKLTAEETAELAAMTAEADAPEVVAEETAPSQDALVTYLKEQITEKDTEISSLKAQVITSEAGKTELDALTTIAINATAKMRIALSLAAVDMADWKVDAVLTEHANTLKSFEGAFKIGGVARVLTDDGKQEQKTKATVTKLDDARVKSVGL